MTGSLPPGAAEPVALALTLAGFSPLSTLIKSMQLLGHGAVTAAAAAAGSAAAAAATAAAAAALVAAVAAALSAASAARVLVCPMARRFFPLRSSREVEPRSSESGGLQACLRPHPGHGREAVPPTAARKSGLLAAAPAGASAPEAADRRARSRDQMARTAIAQPRGGSSIIINLASVKSDDRWGEPFQGEDPYRRCCPRS